MKWKDEASPSKGVLHFPKPPHCRNRILFSSSIPKRNADRKSDPTLSGRQGAQAYVPDRLSLEAHENVPSFLLADSCLSCCYLLILCEHLQFLDSFVPLVHLRHTVLHPQSEHSI